MKSEKQLAKPSSIIGEVRIPQNKVGIVYKKWGKPSKTLIACDGEAGIQADILELGLHFGKWPLMYEIELVDIVEIKSGEIGIVTAQDGAERLRGRNFGKVVPESNNYQDAKAFLKNGGERGIQQAILPEGRYFINTKLFEVRIEQETIIAEDEIGLVEAMDGEPLRFGHLVARDVFSSNFSFENPQEFFEKGGQRGKQTLMLRGGTYQINTELFKVTREKFTRIEDGKIGLVEALAGKSKPSGQEFGIMVVDCEDFQDAELFLKEGQQGKQQAILRSGIYQINTYVFKVRIVDQVSIKPGQIGLVTAKYGKPTELGDFGKVVDCNDFQDTQAFLNGDGQKGKQLPILKPGNYEINRDLFDIEIVDQVSIESGQIGLVTAKYGKPLESGSFGKVVDCKDFQDAQAFIYGGGQRGKQLLILRTGNYQINTNLFDVEIEEATIIPPNHIGLVTAKAGKPSATFGKVVQCSNFEDAQAFIYGDGQQGEQLAYLENGNYYINKYLFEVETVPITKINDNQIGLVEALDGKPLQPGRNFGKVVPCNDFQDPQAFVDGKGQKGSQLAFLSAGNYTINTNFFKITPIDLVEIPEGKIGIVEALDGKDRPANRKFGKVVEKCDNFQNAQAFIDNEGEKGIQQAVLPPGKYQINTKFFKIEIAPATKISNDEIGLVTANDGDLPENGEDLGQIVECENYQNPKMFFENEGQIGKQLAILREGIYFINPYLFTVEIEKATYIPTDKVGIVNAIRGVTRPSGKRFAQVIEPSNFNNFQNSEQFIKDKGQQGLQMPILTAGYYYINTYLFEVELAPVTKIAPDEVGLISANEGEELENGKMFGKVVKKRDNFQDPMEFIKNGGQKGKQIAFLQQGEYYINTEFFNVRKDKIVKIGKDHIGLVIANDGEDRPRGQELGNVISKECKKFQKAELFLAEGGQKGKQLSFLTTGDYRINTDLFTVYTVDNIDEYNANAKEEDKLKPEDLRVTVIEENHIGIVITNAGKITEITEADDIPEKDELADSVIEGHEKFQKVYAGPVIKGHENFTKPEVFIKNGGQKGLQEEIIPPASYSLNPWFVKVKQVPIIHIPNGHVGVVTSYIGKKPEDNTQLVERGYKGIWKTPLEPGRHLINTEVYGVSIVPTNNITLKWTDRIEEDKEKKQDQNNSKICKFFDILEIQDTRNFVIKLEVTQVIRIEAENASEIVSKLGGKFSVIEELVVEMLQPTIKNYFREAIQEHSLENFPKEANNIVENASNYIQEAIKRQYGDSGLKAISTVIETIIMPPELAEIDRKIEILDKSQKLDDQKAKRDLKEHQNKAKIAEAQRDEEAKQLDADIDKRTKKKKAEYAIVSTKLDLNQRKQKQVLDLDAQRKQLEAQFQQALSQCDLSPDQRARIQELQVSQGTLQAMATIQLAIQSNVIKSDVEKSKWKYISGIKLPDNPKFMMDGKALQGSSLHSFLRDVSDIFGLDKSNSNSITQVLGQLDSNQVNPDKINEILQQLGFNPDKINEILQQSGFNEQNRNTQVSGSPTNPSLNQNPPQQQLTQSTQPNPYQQPAQNQPGITQPNTNSPSNNSVQQPFNLSQFVTPTEAYISPVPMLEPRCPLVLLLDTSDAMIGERIKHLNNGLLAFQQKVALDDNLLQSLDLAIATFNSYGRAVQNFIPAHQFTPPKLTAGGETVMGKGIELALDEIENYQKNRKAQNIEYRKPWVFLIMGSQPTDDCHNTGQRIKQAVQTNQINCFVVGVQGADMTSLKQIAPPNTPPLMLDGLKFRELFHWLADALKEVANSKVGSKVSIPPITKWSKKSN